MSETEVRVELPFHLRTLARVEGHEVRVRLVGKPPTVRGLLDALEATYPMLAGTVREYETGARRAYLRFFACGQDVSFAGMDARLPEAVVDGREPFLILGAVSGG